MLSWLISNSCSYNSQPDICSGLHSTRNFDSITVIMSGVILVGGDASARRCSVLSCACLWRYPLPLYSLPTPCSRWAEWSQRSSFGYTRFSSGPISDIVARRSVVGKFSPSLNLLPEKKGRSLPSAGPFFYLIR